MQFQRIIGICKKYLENFPYSLFLKFVVQYFISRIVLSVRLSGYIENLPDGVLQLPQRPQRPRLQVGLGQVAELGEIVLDTLSHHRSPGPWNGGGSPRYVRLTAPAAVKGHVKRGGRGAAHKVRYKEEKEAGPGHAHKKWVASAGGRKQLHIKTFCLDIAA